MTLLSKICETVSSLTQPLSDPLDSPTEFAEPVVENRRSTASKQDLQFCRVMLAERQPDDRTLARAWRRVEETMAYVPGGETNITPMIAVASPDTVAAPFEPVAVDAFYLDRHTVTNEQYARFVDDGGYDCQDLWAAETLPYLLQFVDRSGLPGPKYWESGKPPAGKLQHPVVGISWFEAQAFACWAGRQLPTPAEWQHAASWFSTADASLGTSYPWGNAFNPDCANTWHSKRGDTVEVTAYRDGSTPNGLFQLIGNVWEWTGVSLGGAADEQGNRLIFEHPMAEVRGGAFDTYFETQATCQFRTGQRLLYRGPNVGIRCCVRVADLPPPPDPSVFAMTESEW